MMRSGALQRRRAALVVVSLAALTLVGPLPAGGRLAVALAPYAWGGAPIAPLARLRHRPVQLSPVVARLPLVGVDAVVDDQTNHVFVSGAGTADDGRVSMLDAHSGARLRTVRVATYSGYLTLDAPLHRVYVSTEESTDGPFGLRILDTRTDRPVGWVPVADPISGVVADAATDRLFVVTDPRGSTGPVHVLILERQRARVLRTIRLGTGIGQAALDAQTNRVFVAVLGQDAVTLLDTRSGQVVRTVRLPIQPLEMAVDAATQRVFVVGDTGMRVLDARSGAILPTGQTSDHDGAVAAAGSRAYITVDYGLLIVDGRTGARLRTVALDPHGQGTGPSSLPVFDPQRRRLYLVLTTPVEVDLPNGDSTESYRNTLAVLDSQTGALQRQLDLHDTGGGFDVVRLAARRQRLVVLTGSVTTVLDLTRL